MIARTRQTAAITSQPAISIFAEVRMVLWEPLEYVGETLVFIGVVGEVYAEWPEPERKKLAKASSLVLIVGLALSLAALIGTNEHFNGTIADLNLQASNATERAAKAEESTQQLKTDAEEAHKAAEAEKLARLKLEAEIQPREYTPSEIRRIAKSCSPYAGTPIVMRSLPYDVEGAVFATYLAGILRTRCHMRVDTSGVANNFMQNLPMFTGVYVVGPLDEKSQTMVRALATSLNTKRVPAFANPSAPGFGFGILVGAKGIAPPSWVATPKPIPQKSTPAQKQ